MMPILINSILFYYLNGELNGAKEWPDWFVCKLENLENLLGLNHLSLKENDESMVAILDLIEAAELWGFINGIKFMYEIIKEI